MHHTPALRTFVAAWESLRLRAYDDGGGVLTIGYGHTKGVQQGDVCTVEEAEAWLDEELGEAGQIVNDAVKVTLLQHQFDACASLTYNIGRGKAGVADGFAVLKNGQPSTLLRAINADQHGAAITQFLRWNKDNGQVLRGLLARRAGEGLIYAFADYTGC